MARFFVLVITSIVGMAMLGVTAFVTAVNRSGPWGPVRPDEWALLAYPATVGALLGVFSMPFVVAFLKEANLLRSLSFVYGVSLIVTILWASLIPIGFGISAAFPAFFSVIVLSRWCADRFALPQPAGHCEKCDYDLTGCTERGCPECGWGRTSDRSAP